MAVIRTRFLIGLSLLLSKLEALSAEKVVINESGCGMSDFRRIVNGTEARQTQFPWAVFLSLYYSNNEYNCGGTIITKRHVLTAAHCLILKNVYVGRVDVMYGNVDHRHARKVPAEKMLIHKDYHRTHHVNDIALLVVKYPFEYTRDAGPICLPLSPLPVYNTTATVAGWGSLYYGGQAVNHLRFTEVTVLPNDICQLTFRHLDYKESGQYCAQRRSTSACRGDSGGPLMTRVQGGRYVQVGIVSYGTGCGGIFTRQVYTRVEGYIDWLTRGVASNADYMDLYKPKEYIGGSPIFPFQL